MEESGDAMRQRIQKILSQRGVASRRQAEEMLLSGRVSCNGTVCSVGQSADPDTDVILVDGRPLPSTPDTRYLMLHKPRGYVTTLSDEKGRKEVTQLLTGCSERVYPIGRLDMDSEGLLLFTNDGEFANRLMHPKHQVEKTYHVHVKGFSQEGLERLSRPVTLDGYTIVPPKVALLGQAGQTAQISVTIHEGRNRQVRRMCALAGLTVVRLIRVREGAVELGDLPLGKWRYLSQEEISILQSHT